MVARFSRHPRSSRVQYILFLASLFSSTALFAARLSIKGGLNATDNRTQKPLLLLASNDEYSLEISTGQEVDDHLIEGIDEGGFVLQRNGTMQNTSFVNGHISREITTTFSVRPTMTGDFILGPAVVHGNQGEEMTNTVSVRVLSQKEYDKLAGRAGARGNRSRRTCVLSIDRPQVVVGEPVRVTVLLEDDGDVIERGLADMTFQGMSYTKDEKPSQSERLVNGKLVHQLSQSYTVTPEAPGTFVLGPATGEFIVPDNSNPFGGMMGFMGGNIFGGGKRRRVQSESVKITVDPLPQTNLMVDGIGKFESLEARMATRAAQINEPLELTLVLKGEGNFEAIVAPELQVPPHMTVYDSGTEFFSANNDPRSGSKIFKYVVQVGESGTHQLPAQEFVFFDTATQKYRALRSAVQHVTVKDASGVAATMQSSPTAAAPLKTEESAEEPEPVGVLSEIDTASLPISSPLQGFAWWWFVMAALLPLVWLFRRYLRDFWFALTELTGITSQYKRDVAQLDALIAANEAGELQEFFTLLLARRWDMDASLVDATLIGRETSRFGWPQSKRNQFNEYLDSCGQAAFAPELMSEREQQELLKKSLYWFELVTHAPLLKGSDK